jgi:hypothetical protein
MLSLFASLVLSVSAAFAADESSSTPAPAVVEMDPATIAAPPQGAVDLPATGVDPRDEAAQWESARNQLKLWSRDTDRAVVGRVVALRSGDPQNKSHDIVVVQVEKVLRGRNIPVFFEVRLRSQAFSSQPDVPPPTVVSGYRVLVLVDNAGYVVADQAILVVEGGYAWQARRDGVFERPAADRVWSDQMNPSADYAVFSLEEIRSTLNAPAERRRRKS